MSAVGERIAGPPPRDPSAPSAHAPAAGARAAARAPAWCAPLLLGAMVAALVAGRFETALLAVAVAVVASTAAGPQWPSRRWLTVLATGSLVAIVLNVFLTPGRAIGSVGLFGWPATYEGLGFGVLLALRLIGATTALQGLRAAWPGERGADEMARLLQPLERVRVPVREARLMTGLAMRFVPLLRDESARIAALQRLRAGAPPRGLAERVTRLRAALVPTMVAAVERAERTAQALEARHYRMRPMPARAEQAAWAAWLGVALAIIALVWRGR